MEANFYIKVEILFLLYNLKLYYMETGFPTGSLKHTYGDQFPPSKLNELRLSEGGKPYQAVQLYSRDNGGWCDVTKIRVCGNTANVTYEGYAGGLVMTLRI